MVWNSQPVMSRRLRFKNDVAAFLIDTPVTVMFAEQFDQLRPAQVAGELHVQAKSSSRTKCRRTAAGLGRSKK